MSREPVCPFYYVTGGTLKPNAPCYVEREADALLLEALRAREFCYVLTARQTGKSSLMVRTAASLREGGDRVAILDLTLLGQQLTREQWYYGLLDLLAEQLGLEEELGAFWSEHPDLGAAQRFLTALARVALPRSSGRLVIFIDEVDAVQALPFSTDEFFAGIRACYNRRATGELEGLTFCLLGVAAPADLIQDPRTTPFNIGRRIELTDFTPAEAARLAEGLRCGPHSRTGAAAQALLHRVLYWTHGHPSLTQQFCKALAENVPGSSPREVDRVCRELFLSAGARRRDEHLLFVQERLLRAGDSLPALLALYERLLSGRTVEDRQGSVYELLRLAGIVRTRRGQLEIRNRIYARVFDRAWLAEHLPDAEARRQKAAFRKGVLRAGAIAGVLIGLLGGVAALFAVGEARTRQQADYLQTTLQQRDQLLGERQLMLGRLERTVKELTEQRQAARAEARRASSAETQERQQRGAADAARRVAEFQRTLAMNLRQASEGHRRKMQAQLVRLQIAAGESEFAEGRTLAALPWFVEALRREESNPDRAANHRIRVAAALEQGPRLLRLWRPAAPVRQMEFSPDGRTFAIGHADGRLTLHNAGEGRQLGPALQTRGCVYHLSFSPDSRRVAVVNDGYEVQVRSASSGRLLGRTVCRPEEPLSTVFTSDGKLLLGLRSGAIWSWDFAQGTPPREVAREAVVPPDRLLLSRDDRFLVVSGQKDCAIWDWRLRRRIKTVPGNHASALTGDDCLLAQDHQGYSFRKLPELPLLRAPIPAHSGNRFSADGHRLFTVQGDGRMEEWDSRTGVRTSESPQLPGSSWLAAISPDGRRVALADAERVIRLWDPGTEPAQHEIRAPVPSGLPDLSPDGGLVTLPGEDGRVRIWSTKTGWSVGPEIWHGSRALHAAFSPDGRWIATAGVGGPPRLREAKTGRSAALRLEAPRELPVGGWISWLVFSPRGDHLLAARSDFRAEIYDLRSGRIISPLMPCPFPPRGRSPFSRDGQQLLLARGPYDALLWVKRGGKFVDSRLPGTIPPQAIFSPDGQLLLGPGERWTPGFVSVRTGRRVGREAPFGHGVAGMHLSPDGLGLATTGEGAVRLWDYRKRRPLLPPFRHKGGIGEVAFSRNGRRLVALGAGSISVWDAESGEPLTPALPAPGVIHARFDASGERVIGLRERGGVLVWRLRQDPRRVSDLQQLATVLTGERPHPSAGLESANPEALVPAFRALRQRYPREFRPSPGRELTWHAQKALSAENASLWEVAVAHLDHLIALDPSAVEFYARRGKAHAELSHWAAAARDFQVPVQRGAGEPMAYYQLALSQLGAGDMRGYRRTCAAMLSRYRETGVRYRDLATWTCALGPGAKPEIEQAIVLVQELLAHQGRSESWLGTLGALQCRAGRHTAALKSLREARELRDAQGNTDGSPVDLLFYGLACGAAGEPAEARVALQRAREKRAEMLRPNSGHHVDWQGKLTVQLLERELAAVLTKK